MHWQVQKAKQRFSEVLRCARGCRARFVSRRGEAVAVVLDIDEYRRLSGSDFKSFLRFEPSDDLEIRRSPELPRDVDFLGEA